MLPPKRDILTRSLKVVESNNKKSKDMAYKPITKRANGNITPKPGPGDLKPGEKRVPSTSKPLSQQGGIDPGSIRKMTPADTSAFSKPGYRIDLSRSMTSTKGGTPYSQPEYIKLATPAKKVTPVTTKKTTTTTKPSSTTTKATTTKPSTTTKPASTTTKPATSTEVKKESAPKERVAYRNQNVIDASGKQTIKRVVYSKYDEKTKKWVDQNPPVVIDYRKNEKIYMNKKREKIE